MRLLFDENLSPKLVQALAGDYPDSSQVSQAGLRGATDRTVWDYARAQGFVIVSKDTDFRERSFADGFPPKVVWLDVGNANTLAIISLLRRELPRLEHFVADSEAALLILSG